MRLLLAVSLLPALLAPLTAQAGDAKDPKGLRQEDPPAWMVIPSSPVRTPDEELATFVVEPGYRVQLVAAEPLVQDPVALRFDEQGRAWVVEMRGYMPNADGDGEKDAVGSIAVLEDTDGDGQMDKRTVYADQLAMPRAVLPLGDGEALVLAPPHFLHLKDRDGDGIADERTAIGVEFDNGFTDPEHAANTPTFGLDNWIYLARFDKRLRLRDGVWEVEPSAFGGQWGLGKDDAGGFWFNTNSDHLRAHLAPPHYVGLHPRLDRPAYYNQRIGHSQEVFPIRITPGVNRGYQKNVLRGDGRLRTFTAVCGPTVYRGDLMPELRGDVFVVEPACHVVRRAKITPDGTQARGENAYPDREFLASTDERFRPVFAETGPDGALYLVDLYRGLIQHRNYLTSYLRRQVEGRGLAAPIHVGRIWRVVPAPEGAAAGSPVLASTDLGVDPAQVARADRFEMPDGSWLRTLNGAKDVPALEWPSDLPYAPVIGKSTDGRGQDWYRHADGSWSTTTVVQREDLGRPESVSMVANPKDKPAPAPISAPPVVRVSDAATAVALLSHPNGTVRDLAQRRLVRRPAEARSHLGEIVDLARHGTSLARVHALWTLEGIGALDRHSVLLAVTDADPMLRAQGAQLLGAWLASAEGDAVAVGVAAHRAAAESDPQVQLQLAFALGRVDHGRAAFRAAADEGRVQLLVRGAADPRLRDAVLAGQAGAEVAFAAMLAADSRFAEPAQGYAEVFTRLADCVFRAREDGEMRGLLGLAANTPHAWQRQALLAGVEAALPRKGTRKIAMAGRPASLDALTALGDPKVDGVLARFEESVDFVADAGAASLSAAQQARFDAGAAQYAVHCTPCHQTHGQGLEGLAPPLAGSEWVLGAPEVLARIVLQGLTGPIEVAGRRYEYATMPDHGKLTDEELAAILTYVRRAWDNQAAPVEPATVEGVRAEPRTTPWTAAALLGGAAPGR
ncbi:MAG: PVC-type heme-binding CxxCH protein [Planctomycetota bacterium]